MTGAGLTYGLRLRNISVPSLVLPFKTSVSRRHSLSLPSRRVYLVSTLNQRAAQDALPTSDVSRKGNAAISHVVMAAPKDQLMSLRGMQRVDAGESSEKRQSVL